MLQYIKEYGKYVEITGYQGIMFEKAGVVLELVSVVFVGCLYRILPE